MSPPPAVAGSWMGVTTSPSLDDLKSFARFVLQNVGVSFGANRINRLAVNFARSMPEGSGYAFFLYLTNAVQMSTEQKRSALSNPDVARAISYLDPTGETAVNRVMRGYR